MLVMLAMSTTVCMVVPVLTSVVMRMLMRLGQRNMVIVLDFGFVAEIVLVKVKHAQQQQHYDEADHQPPDGGIHALHAAHQCHAVRQQVVEGHAQHKSGYA